MAIVLEMSPITSAPDMMAEGSFSTGFAVLARKRELFEGVSYLRRDGRLRARD